MKKCIFIILLISIIISYSFSQYKSRSPEKTSAAYSLIRPSSGVNGVLNWFNPNNFRMRHNLSLHYLSIGSSGLSIASYTNSMVYKISDPLNIRMDISLMGSPLGSYGSIGNANYNKLFVSRAELNYQPFENFHLQLQYRHLPISNYGYYTPYHWFTGPHNLEDE